MKMSLLVSLTIQLRLQKVYTLKKGSVKSYVKDLLPNKSTEKEIFNAYEHYAPQAATAALGPHRMLPVPE